MDDAEIEVRMAEIEPTLRLIAKSYLRNYEDQQDAVQECLLKAWRSRKQLKYKESFDGWIRRIMKNECISLCRKKVKCVCFGEETLVFEDDPIARYIEHEALYNAIERLSSVNREAIYRHFVEGQSFRELADVYGLNRNTLQTRVYRALKQLNF